MGHGGTLDMEATGVLTVGIGKGCSCLPAFLSGEKRYTTTGKLGIETDTLNSSGSIVRQCPYDSVTQESLLRTIQSYEGEHNQVPPIYSALKRNGQRLSDLARQGLEVTPKPARKVEVHKIKLIDFRPPYFSMEIHSGGGFYVRQLIHDIGHDVGSCACMVELERTQHGPFRTENAIPTDEWTVSEVLESVKANRTLLKSFISNAVKLHKLGA